MADCPNLSSVWLLLPFSNYFFLLFSSLLSLSLYSCFVVLLFFFFSDVFYSTSTPNWPSSESISILASFTVASSSSSLLNIFLDAILSYYTRKIKHTFAYLIDQVAKSMLEDPPKHKSLSKLVDQNSGLTWLLQQHTLWQVSLNIFLRSSDSLAWQ